MVGKGPQADRRSRRAEHIYWAIVDWLASSHKHPGDRLPSEAQLAKQFGISRPTLREAIRVLEYSGMVEVRRGRNGGIFVGTGAMQQVIGALHTLLRFDQTSLDDLFEARELLEVAVTHRAAQTMTERHLAMLAASIETLEADCSIETAASANTTFHLTIAEGCGNAVLRAMMTALTTLLCEVVTHAPNNQATVCLRVAGHRAIYEALQQRDSDAAAQAMRDHVRAMYADMVDSGQVVPRTAIGPRASTAANHIQSVAALAAAYDL